MVEIPIVLSLGVQKTAFALTSSNDAVIASGGGINIGILKGKFCRCSVHYVLLKKQTDVLTTKI